MREFRGNMVITFDRQSKGALALERMDELTPSIQRWLEKNLEHIDFIVPLEKALTSDPIQAMFCGPIARMRQAMETLVSSALAQQIAIVRTEYPLRDLTIVDVLGRGCSKGHAVKRWAAYRGVSHDQVMAIGDNYNDVEMLAFAGHPFIMGNACEELKARGWPVTLSSDECGVAVAWHRVPWTLGCSGLWNDALREKHYADMCAVDNRIVLAPSLTWRPTNNTNWTVLGTYQKDKTGSSTAFLPHEGTLFPGPNGLIPVRRFAGVPGFDKYQTETGAISSLFEHSFGDALKIRQNMRYAHVEGIYRTAYPNVYGDPYTPPNPNFPFLDPSRRTVERYIFSRETSKDSFTSDSNAELKFQTGPVLHKTLLGVDYRGLNERARSGSGYDTTPFDLYAPVYNGVVAPDLVGEPDLRQSQLGLYAQDQMRLGPWLAVVGLRQDYVTNNVQGSPAEDTKATTGRAGLMYELPFGLTPYVTYAQSFTPIFGSGVCAGICKAQRGEMVELGFKYNPLAGTAINGAIYDTTEKNRLASSPDPLISVQTGKVRIRGAELEVITRVTPDLDLIGAYAYVNAMVESGDNAGKHVETVPEHQASLWAKYRLTALGLPGVTIGSGVRYIGESWDGTDTIRTPDYTLFDGMIRYETGPWRFQVNASNIADKRHVTTCLARGDCFFGIGRTVLGSATYRF